MSELGGGPKAWIKHEFPGCKLLSFSMVGFGNEANYDPNQFLGVGVCVGHTWVQGLHDRVNVKARAIDEWEIRS